MSTDQPAYFSPLQLGDVLAVDRTVYTHEGIVAGTYASGECAVISNTLGQGVIVEPLSRFAAGSTVRRIPLEPIVPRLTAIQRARSRVGDRYDLWTWNCQHFVRWAIGRPAESPQLQLAFCTAAGLGLLAVVFTSRRS